VEAAVEGEDDWWDGVSKLMAAYTSDANSKIIPSETGIEIRQCRVGGEEGRIGSMMLTSREFAV
jgi:hypothetical protein